MAQQQQAKRSWDSMSWDVSATKLRTYATCPRRFAFRYVLKIKGQEGDFAGVGKAVHSALELVARKRINQPNPEPATSDEMIAALQGLGIPNPGDLDGAAEVLLALAPFSFKGTVVGVEQDFQIDIGGGERAGGFMDLVTLEHEGRVLRVTDYKSGFVMPKQSEAHLDPQIRLYLVAAKELWPHVPTILVELLQVPTLNRVIAEWSPQLDMFTRVHMRGCRTHWNSHPGPKDDSKEEQKRFGRDYPARLGKHCSHCPFTDQCHEHKNWLKEPPPLPGSVEQHNSVAWQVEALEELKAKAKVIEAEIGRKTEKVLAAMGGSKSLEVTSLHYKYSVSMVQQGMTFYPPSILPELAELEDFDLEELVRDCAKIAPKKLLAKVSKNENAKKIVEELARKGHKKPYVSIKREEP